MAWPRHALPGLFVVATPSRWTARQDFSRADLVLPTLGDPAAVELSMLQRSLDREARELARAARRDVVYAAGVAGGMPRPGQAKRKVAGSKPWRPIARHLGNSWKRRSFPKPRPAAALRTLLLDLSSACKTIGRRLGDEPVRASDGLPKRRARRLDGSPALSGGRAWS